MAKKAITALGLCLGLALLATYLLHSSRIDRNIELIVGTVTAVGPGGKTLTVRGDDGAEKTFRVDPSRALTVFEESMEKTSMANFPYGKNWTNDALKVGWAVQLKGYGKDAGKIVTSPTLDILNSHLLGLDGEPRWPPRAERTPFGDHLTGTITAVGRDADTMTLQGADGAEKTLYMSNETRVEVLNLETADGPQREPKDGTRNDLKVGWAAYMSGYGRVARLLVVAPTLESLESYQKGPASEPPQPPKAERTRTTQSAE